MDIGFILIVSILVLGGVIATAGDRIGTRVGKARLSLFKLRPRQTAVLVTIVTGVTISGSTLAILLATSKPLRTGLFQLDEIQKQLRKARGDLDQTLTQKQQTEAQKTQVESELAKTETQKKQIVSELSKTAAQKKQIESELAKTAAQKKQTESELAKTEAQKKQTEKELAKTRAGKAEAQKRLDATNESLQAAIAKQAETAQQASALRSEIRERLAEREQLIQQRQQVKTEINQLQAENEQWKAQNNQLKAQNSELKDKVTEKDREIAQQDQVIAQGATLLKEREKQLKQAITVRETRLDELEQQLKEREKQLTFLQQELATQEQYYQYYQALRQGNVALLRGQVLASAVLRIVDPSAARSAVDQLLSQAHRSAIRATRPANSKDEEIVVQIYPAQVEQLINQIKDGQDYVVRILSAGNYVMGEKHVQVFADAALNQIVFSAGDVVAATSADPSKMSEEEIRQRLEQLVAASQFRARRAGIVVDQIQIGDGRITTLISFIEQLKQYNKPVDLQAVIEEDTYTAGPLKMNLVAVGNGKVVSKT